MNADICSECGSGILDGEHIAYYPCSSRVKSIHGKASNEATEGDERIRTAVCCVGTDCAYEPLTEALIAMVYLVVPARGALLPCLQRDREAKGSGDLLMTTDELRGNVEAGLRLLLKSEKPLYRRAAEVGITDLREITKRAEEANTLAHAIQRYADTLILDQPLDETAPLSRAIVAHDLRSFLNFAANGGLLTTEEWPR